MDIEVHKRAVSIIHIVLGVLTVAFMFFAYVFLKSFSPIILDEIARDEGREVAMVFEFFAFLSTSLFAFLLLIGPLPSILGGIAVLNNKKWGMVLLMIAGCISLINFPLGTAKGAYTIWVYVEDNKIKNDENKQ